METPSEFTGRFTGFKTITNLPTGDGRLMDEDLKEIMLDLSNILEQLFPLMREDMVGVTDLVDFIDVLERVQRNVGNVRDIMVFRRLERGRG